MAPELAKERVGLSVTDQCQQCGAVAACGTEFPRVDGAMICPECLAREQGGKVGASNIDWVDIFNEKERN